MRQTNFSAGELDPLLQGRTDLPIFGQGLRTCRNFFISKQGAAVSRPGTKYVATTGLGVFMSGGRDVGRVRLIPFVAGDSASYVLEVGHEYIHFHSLGRTVESSPGVTYFVTTTWQVEDLDLLRFAQVGDVMTIVNPARHPGAWELRYLGAASWTLEEVSYAPPDPLWPDIAASVAASPNNPAGTPGTTGTTPFMLLEPLPTPDSDHPAREWRWGVTAIMQEVASGIIVESVMSEVTQSTDGVEDAGGNPVRNDLADNEVAVYPDMAVTLTRLGLLTAVGDDYRTLAFNIYRGRGDLFGFVGQTRGRTFVDIGSEPDYTAQPPLGTNPFRILLDAPSYGGRLEAVERPAAVAFFQERRCFGRNGGAATLLPYDSSLLAISPRKQPRLHLSATGDYFNFDTRLAVHVSGEALDLIPASRKRETLRHLVEAARLVVFHDATARALGGTQGPLDWDDIDFPVVDEVGASDVVPLVIDGAVLFIRAKGSGARALVPTTGGGVPYEGADISATARHLFVGADRTVVDWCYAEDPWGLVWAVRADGSMLSLTFSRDRQLVAWTRHDTDGTVERVCAVPEGEEDAVYVVVKRTINGTDTRYIERMTSRVRRVLEDDEEDPAFVANPTRTDTDTLYPTDVCLDCAFTYSGAVPAGNLISDPLLLKLLGQSVYVTGRGLPVLGPYVVTENGANGEVQLDPDITLEANAVDDADVPIMVAHVGLAFTCDLETLAVRGPPTLQQKTIGAVGFELDSARGVQTGQDFDHLDDWQQREVSDSYDAVSAATTLLYATAENAWDKDARACLRQAQPLPVTVVGITRDVVSNG